MPPSEHTPSPEAHRSLPFSALVPVVRAGELDPALVRELAAIGVSEEDIAAHLGVPLADLNELFAPELKQGAAHGREQALRKLHFLAMTGDNIALLTFWIKSRCGWRDTGSPQSLLSIVRHISEFAPEGEKLLDHHPL
ncbi:MAG TPA: hypothetical protein VH302_08585 [Bryobacteraceae bacterium]|nr:hypothetical protein [Bryobacteraceae bacterium]